MAVFARSECFLVRRRIHAGERGHPGRPEEPQIWHLPLSRSRTFGAGAADRPGWIHGGSRWTPSPCDGLEPDERSEATGRVGYLQPTVHPWTRELVSVARPRRAAQAPGAGRAHRFRGVDDLRWRPRSQGIGFELLTQTRKGAEMAELEGRRYVLISSDAHAGADLLDYKPYLEREFHDEFDAWAASYQEDA